MLAAGLREPRAGVKALALRCRPPARPQGRTSAEDARGGARILRYGGGGMVLAALPAATAREGSRAVEIQGKRATVKGGSENFTGDVWLDAVAQGAEPSRLRVNHVHFAPGARTAWHSHPVGQTLYVTDGRGRVQARGGDVAEISTGQVIYTPPSEWHWHGATPDHFMAHLSLVEADEHGTSATWGAHVTDEEYGAAPRSDA